MKKRKILYLFPLAALVLSGCTLQEGWDIVKDFSVNKVYEPVRDFFLNLLGKEVPKKEEQKPSGEGEGGGQHEEEISKYGTLAHPLTVSEAAALIDSEDPTLEQIYVTGEIIANEAWNTEYGQVTITISDGEKSLQVFRANQMPDGFDAESITQNSLKGMSLIASGEGTKYNSTYELAQGCVVHSFSGEAVKPEEVDNYGTLENPLTVTEAIEVIQKQDPTKQPIYVIGEVSGNGAWSTQYGNIDIYLTDGVNEIQMFRCNKFPEGYAYEGIQKNDLIGKTIIGKGTGTYYVAGNKYELDQKCEVVSITDEVIEITGVELSATQLALEVGQQATLTAKVLPEEKASQEVTWTVTSETADVITCNNGVIVANAVGTAVVTATSVADPTKTAECAVTVTEATKELLNLAFAGEVTKTEYVEDEEYSAAGLKVMAHYNVGEDEDITENATITLSKEKAEVGDTSFTVTASYGNAQPIEKVVNVTVSALDRSIKTAYEAGLALEPGKSTSDAYTFRGTCTAITGNSFFLQDDGYGMYVYNKATENLEVGKLVEVTSTIQNYSGLVETKSISSSKVIGNGTLPAAIEITGLNSFERQNILANAKSATFVSKDADWSSSKASLAVFNIGGDDITIKFDKYGFEAEKGALLNGAKEGDVFDLSNIETSFNNTKQLLFCGTSSIVKTGSAPAKEIASIVSITGPEEIALNATISPSEVTVVVAYTDQTQGNAEVKTVTVDSSTAGQKSADVTIEGWDETLHFTVLVKDEAAPTPQHAGTEADPYTVSDAKILFNDLDDGENTAECYVTGTIVADPAPSISGTRYRFYLSDGVSTTNLYAYNVDPLSGTTAHLANIPYGSVVVAKGAIKNFGGTFELCYVKDVASCILTSVERPELSSVVISGTASQTEYAVGADYNHNGLVATANFASGAAIDVSDLASWSIDPATASEGDTSISITASYDNVNSAAFNVSVTVTGTGPVTPTYYDATMAGKDNASTVTVNGNSAIKCGASSKAGSMTVTVPSGATKLRIYIGGWNNDTGRTINVTLSGNATISPTSFNVVNESVFSGTATSFTVADESIHLYEFTLSGVTEETTITFTANAASKNRFIAWGAQYAK